MWTWMVSALGPGSTLQSNMEVASHGLMRPGSNPKPNQHPIFEMDGISTGTWVNTATWVKTKTKTKSQFGSGRYQHCNCWCPTTPGGHGAYCQGPPRRAKEDNNLPSPATVNIESRIRPLSSRVPEAGQTSTDSRSAESPDPTKCQN